MKQHTPPAIYIQKHDFLINISLTNWYIDFVMTTYILNGHVYTIELFDRGKKWEKVKCTVPVTLVQTLTE